MLATWLLVAAVFTQPIPAVPSHGEQTETCLTCHADEALSVTLPSGETRALSVDADTFGRSVHGDKLTCVDCHTDTTTIPHDARLFQTRREFTRAYTEQCKRCHFANFAKTMDGVHARALERGDTTAPLCVDCHGAHDVAAAAEPRGRISQTCAKCHAGVAEAYARSVHGEALANEHNPDVPTCTDCHRAHDVAGPTAKSWLDRTPDLCARCHADRQLMSRYGISTAVQSTYLVDFHGKTESLRGSGGQDGTPLVARCTDCHGVHDILKPSDPDSPVLKGNLVKTCRQCHPDATENFPSAWLSHYEPSWDRTPLVYAVTLAYKFLIPFMIGGLLLQVFLHLWRVVVNR
ncbi:MAG: cytochrome c3 family protein [Vicinamibacterales bacterium]